jgi:uncharacterized protein (TIGR00369 family)
LVHYGASRFSRRTRDALVEQIPFLQHAGVEIEQWSSGRAVVGLRIQAHHLNRAGIVHGGLYSVLADAAGGLAGCYSDDPNEKVLACTVTLTTNFLDSAREGRLRAVGTVMRSGRRLYFSSVDIECEGRRVAIAQGSFMLGERTPRKDHGQ